MACPGLGSRSKTCVSSSPTSASGSTMGSKVLASSKELLPTWMYRGLPSGARGADVEADAPPSATAP
eukprot:13945594-Alexandrium_andersonii.AAC.1